MAKSQFPLGDPNDPKWPAESDPRMLAAAPAPPEVLYFRHTCGSMSIVPADIAALHRESPKLLTHARCIHCNGQGPITDFEFVTDDGEPLA